MAFDPDAFLADEPKKTGGFDPDAFLADDAPAPAPTGPTISAAGAGVTGAIRGATAGFADEIAAGLETTLNPTKWGNFGANYRETRDKARAWDAEADAQHPAASTAGKVAGGIASAFVPIGGVGALAKAGTMGRAVITGAVQGAASGLGESKADLSASPLQNAAQALRDTGGGAAVGAVGGAAFHGVGSLMAGAGRRVAGRVVDAFADGAPAGVRDKLVGLAQKNIPSVIRVVESEPAIAKAAGDPVRLLAATEAAYARHGDEVLAPIYNAADKAAPGVENARVVAAMREVADKWSETSGHAPVADAARKMISAFEAKQAESPWKTGYITFNGLRKEVSALQDGAFKGNIMATTAQKEMAREMSMAARGVLNSAVEDVATQFPQLGISRASLEAANAKSATLANMIDAVSRKATREGTNSTRLKDVASKALDIGLLFTHPQAFVAKKVLADGGGKAMVAGADRALAQLMTAAKNGSRGAQLVELGLKLGLTRNAGESVAAWAGRAGATDDGRGD